MNGNALHHPSYALKTRRAYTEPAVGEPVSVRAKCENMEVCFSHSNVKRFVGEISQKMLL